MTVSFPNDAATQDKALRATFDSGRTRPLVRRQELAALRRMMVDAEEELVEALTVDLSRPRTESYAADIAHTDVELRHLAKHVAPWVKPTKVKVPHTVAPA